MHEIRTDHQESDDVLDFAPYHDEPDDDTDNRTAGPPLPAKDHPDYSAGRKKLFIRAAIFISYFFVLIAIVLIAVWWPWLTRATQPDPAPTARPAPTGPPNRNYSLNFPEVYPKLDVNRSSMKCRAAWATLTNIPCHEGIWLRGWDAGIPNSRSPSVDSLVPLICQDTCSINLMFAERLLRSACVGENVFALEGYSGRFNTTLLEPNPPEVVSILLKRRTRTCRTSASGDAVGGYCMTDVVARFGIIDGIRSDGIEGLNSFLRQTDQKSSREEVTTCSWCTITWFKEKLDMWEEGKIVKDGSAMSLPEYLKMWKSAGRRCAGERFDDIYNAAIKSYVARGLLPKGWLPKPLQGIEYLIRNGASMGDYPVPEVIDLHSALMAYINHTVDDGPGTHKRLILVKEYMACIDSIQLGARSINFYPFLSWANITAYMLSDIDTAMIACSGERLTSVDELHTKFDHACPLFRLGRDGYEEELATLFLPFSIHPILKKFGTVELFRSACMSSKWPRGGVPCAAIYAQWGMQDWALVKGGENMQEIIRVTRRELLRLPEMPSKLKNFTRPINRTLTDEEKAIEIDRVDWVWANSNGVCSDCIWARFLNMWGFTTLIPGVHTLDLAMEWLKTTYLLRGSCLEVGKEFSESELQGASDQWKR